MEVQIARLSLREWLSGVLMLNSQATKLDGEIHDTKLLQPIQSLRNAVLTFVLLPLLGLLVALGMFGVRELEKQMHRRVQDDIELIARSIRLPIAAAMVRGDVVAVREALDSVFQIDQVFGAYVYDRAGEQVATSGPRSPLLERRRDARAVTAEGTQGSVEERRGREVFSFFLPLYDPAGTVVGLLQVTRDLSRFEAYLTRLRWVGGTLVLLVAVLFVLIVLIGHHRAIGRHVRALTAAMAPIGTGESGLRIPVRGPVELKQLGVGINAMIDRWETSERNLRAQREREARLERELRQSEKLAAVGRLAAGLAHELGTPLGSVAGRAQRALRGLPASSPARAELAAQREELDRISRIVRELLDFARRNPLHRRAVLLGPLIDGVVSRCTQAAQRPVAVDVALSPELAGQRLYADPLRLEQALGNLLDNALNAAHARVLISAELDDDGLRLWVSDDGPGIAESARERLFEPFFTTKPVGQGTGLGLAVARAAIAEHDGHLSLEAGGLGGACFQIALPPVIVHGAPEGRAAETSG
ncbi:Sensor protein ZraS [Thiorhodovibrio winogradskyi]|uniref:histidine kinase n=1 Tax=Thiorhodovibrio winogradskyi TaxID=77007 RepID=A0ABZ0S8N8_9GAMM|nr:ATP-binding protein [Thiorhodovibrio winogradskyi]